MTLGGLPRTNDPRGTVTVGVASRPWTGEVRDRKESAMRSVPALAAVVIGAVALASGCGPQHKGTPPGPPLGGSPASSPAPVPRPGIPGAATCHGASALKT